MSTSKFKAYLEHYIVVTVIAAGAIHTAGVHDPKKVAISAIAGVFGPLWTSIKNKFLSLRALKAVVAAAPAKPEVAPTTPPVV